MRSNPLPNWPAPPSGWVPDGDRVRRSGNVLSTAVAAVVLVAAAGATGAVLSGCQSGTPSPGSSSGSSANPISTGKPNPTAARQQVTLPFGGQNPHFYPHGVAVDAQGNVYVTAVNEGVLKLAPGAPAPTPLPFSGLQFATSGGVDTAGNAYVTDDGNAEKGRVQKLDSNGSQTELPFPGLAQDPNLAVASDGTVYVADGGNNRVLKLSPGATSATELPFTGLNDLRSVAVDSTGNVYLSDRGNARVLMLAAGSSNQSVLPLNVQGQQGVAVDSSGNVYAAGSQGVTVLAKDSQQTTQLPVKGETELFGIAVDPKANIYLTDTKNNQVIELKT
jgi:serine/threonine-protein kinase